MKDKIQFFEDKQVRSAWDDENEEWFFSVVDVVGVLSGSTNPTDYLKKMRKRDPELNSYLGTNCPQVAMIGSTGKKRLTLAGTPKHILRVVQSIPSSKAEPLKQWLAQVGSERLEEEIDPQKAIDRARAIYKAKGYPDAWIKARIQGIQARNALTDEWKSHSVQDREYALLTNILHLGTFDISVKDHKKLKGLKKENLRDNMTPVEAALTTLAEVTATEITRAKNPRNLNENKYIAKESGGIAKRARLEIEERTGKKVVSAENANDLIGLGQEKDALTVTVTELPDKTKNN